jgi:hypothetical protein
MEAVPPSRHGASARQTPGPLLQADPGPRLRADWQIINHTIGLTPHAIEVLKALPRAEARVFPMTSKAMRKVFGYARKKAGLTHFRFHDTRHERISNLFEPGWAMPRVMAQIGPPRSGNRSCATPVYRAIV